MREAAGQRLYDQWLRLWNGDLDLAPEIITEGCPIHQAPFGPGEPLALRGPDGIRQMVEMGRAPFQTIAFTLVVGPIVSDRFIAARWRAVGTYAGGLPGATVPAGSEIAFHGNDILRVEDGQIAEYWVSSDGAY
jgi:hypothetical protein